ncbi:MAG: hypothetical protein LBU16_03505 [Treponema sp.]|jgi:hypothetical protein|nr:hypothetical protein [Treponema sp.]
MRAKVSSIIAFISIVVYAAALGIGLVRILAGVNERRAVAQREFYDLADTASSAGTLGFMEERFKDAVRDAVNASRTLLAVIVTGPFGAEFTYERDNNGIIAWEGDTPRFQRRFGVSRNPHFSPLRVNGLRNATIQAVSAAIDYPAFSRILLQSLFLVLAATVLSAVTLVIPRGKGKGAASDTMRKNDPPAPEQAGPDPAKPAREDDEAGMQKKLDTELGICSITDKDLALILMELSLTAGFGVDDDVNRKVADRARQFFNSQDSVYERSRREAAVILPGEGLEDVLSRAKQFHDLILTELPDLFPRKNDLRIGISSRNKRLVRANRLLLEASRALEKANLEPDPIVAFKSDPEKYKAFVQGREKTQPGMTET